MKHQMNNIFLEIEKKILSLWSFQPILFVWDNLELINTQVNNFILDIFKKNNIDKNNLYSIQDDKEKIKINNFRLFKDKSYVKSNNLFQVFLIENISRATNQTLNASLKFLEEPWDWNIIFLTNSSTSNIPETVLSRLKIIYISTSTSNSKNDFYYNLIDEYLKKQNQNLINYFFNDKGLKKEDYMDFLNTFKYYITTNKSHFYILDQIYKSIENIQKHPISPKYEIDKLFLII